MKHIQFFFLLISLSQLNFAQNITPWDLSLINSDLRGYCRAYFYYKDPVIKNVLREMHYPFDDDVFERINNNKCNQGWNTLFGFGSFYGPGSNTEAKLPWNLQQVQRKICLSTEDFWEKEYNGQINFAYTSNSGLEGLKAVVDLGKSVVGAVLSVAEQNWPEALASLRGAYEAANTISDRYHDVDMGYNKKDIYVTYPNPYYNHVVILFDASTKKDKLSRPSISPSGLQSVKINNWEYNEGNGSDGGQVSFLYDINLDSLRMEISPKAGDDPSFGDPFYTTIPIVISTAEHSSTYTNLGVTCRIDLHICRQTQLNPSVSSSLFSPQSSEQLGTIAENMSTEIEINNNYTIIQPVNRDKNIILNRIGGVYFCEQNGMSIPITELNFSLNYNSRRPYEEARKMSDLRSFVKVNLNQPSNSQNNSNSQSNVNFQYISSSSPEYGNISEQYIPPGSPNRPLNYLYKGETGAFNACKIDLKQIRIIPNQLNELKITVGFEDKGRVHPGNGWQPFGVNRQSWSVIHTYHVFIHDKQLTVTASLLPAFDLNGRWNSNIGFSYEIKTLPGEGRFMWERSDKNEYGQIQLLKDDSVRAEWHGGNTGTNPNTRGKIIKKDESGRPILINWNNGVIFCRSTDCIKTVTAVNFQNNPTTVNNYTPSFKNDLSGKWKGNNGITYDIFNNGKGFTWKLANGEVGFITILNDKLSVTWIDAKGNKGQTEGRVSKTGPNNKPEEIIWNNGAVFTLDKSKVPIQTINIQRN